MSNSVRIALIAIAVLLGTCLAVGLVTQQASGQGGVIGEPACYRARCIIHYLPEINHD